MIVQDESINEKRLKALYEITAQPNATVADQFHAALAIGSQTLDTKLAIISHIKDAQFTVMYCLVPPNTIKEGDVFPLEQTYCDITVKKNEVLAIDEMRTSIYDAHPCHDRFKLEAYIGVPIKVNGELYGTINFSSPDPHHPTFTDNDRDFINLLGKWVGTTLERKMADDALVEEREKIKVILDNLPVGVIVFRAPKGDVDILNHAAIIILGKGIDPTAIFENAPEIYKLTHEDGSEFPASDLPPAITLKTNQPAASSDIFVNHPDGTKINTRGTSVPIFDKNGKLDRVILVVEDITREREVDKMKSEFISLASHQLRTPLTGIRWFAELLLKGDAGPITPDQKEYLQEIHDSNIRMINLVNDLLNVSHIETGNKFTLLPKPTDVAPIIDSLSNDLIGLAHAHNVTVNKAADFPKEIILNVDGDKIREIFQNLLSNAIKYSKSGGTVEIGLDTTSQPNQAIFLIKDHGLGIPKTEQARMFEKFFRASNVQSQETDGTGLGMYIAKAIAEKHGGSLRFESEQNVGTTFFLALPK
jgi:signal transduction histidine kinase